MNTKRKIGLGGLLLSASSLLAPSPAIADNESGKFSYTSPINPYLQNTDFQIEDENTIIMNPRNRYSKDESGRWFLDVNGDNVFNGRDEYMNTQFNGEANAAIDARSVGLREQEQTIISPEPLVLESVASRQGPTQEKIEIAPVQPAIDIPNIPESYREQMEANQPKEIPQIIPDTQRSSNIIIQVTDPALPIVEKKIVEDPSSMGGIEIFMTSQLDNYVQTDAALYRTLDQTRNDLVKNTGNPNTFLDDNFEGVVSNLASLSRGLEKAVTEDGLQIRGTATFDLTNETAQYLEGLRSDYGNQLNDTQNGLERFQSLTENENSLPTKEKEKITAQRVAIMDRLGKLGGLITDLDDLDTYFKENFEEPKGFELREFNFDPNADLEGITKFLEDLDTRARKELEEPDLYRSWSTEFFGPQVLSIRNGFDEALSQYINSREVAKTLRNYGFDDELANSIAEEEAKLKDYAGRLNELAKYSRSPPAPREQRARATQQRTASRVRQEARRYTATREGESTTDILFGVRGMPGYDAFTNDALNSDGMIGGDVTLRWGPIGLSVTGFYTPDKNLSKVTQTVGNRTFEGSKDLTGRYSIGVNGELLLWDHLVVGGGPNLQFSTETDSERVTRDGNVLAEKTNSTANMDVSGDVYTGLEFGENFRIGAKIGYDFTSGPYAGVRVGFRTTSPAQRYRGNR